MMPDGFGRGCGASHRSRSLAAYLSRTCHWNHSLTYKQIMSTSPRYSTRPSWHRSSTPALLLVQWRGSPVVADLSVSCEQRINCTHIFFEFHLHGTQKKGAQDDSWCRIQCSTAHLEVIQNRRSSLTTTARVDQTK
jgi:hypothetical protein